ncbi:hypothetical protein [Hymenobacter antarcticus]
MLPTTATSRPSSSTGLQRRRRRSWGVATGGGSCARMLAQSGAGGSWP